MNNILTIIVLFFAILLSSCSPESNQNRLVRYEVSNIKGYLGQPIIVDSYFVEELNKINYWAREYNIKVHITSSFRKQNQELTDTIVRPAKNSNHLIGHAIDMNLEWNGRWYDSKLLIRNNLVYLPQNIQDFVNSIRNDKVLKWGGDFSQQDPVHIDDNTNQNYCDCWHRLYTLYQET